MDRRGFLGRSLGFVAGLTALRHLDHLPPAEVLPEAEVAYSSPSALSPLGASGGFCAPLAPYYSLELMTDRPIRDALPSFRAERGRAITFRSE